MGKLTSVNVYGPSLGIIREATEDVITMRFTEGLSINKFLLQLVLEEINDTYPCSSAHFRIPVVPEIA